MSANRLLYVLVAVALVVTAALVIRAGIATSEVVAGGSNLRAWNAVSAYAARYAGLAQAQRSINAYGARWTGLTQVFANK